jgi:hypothetical protein
MKHSYFVGWGLPHRSGAQKKNRLPSFILGPAVIFIISCNWYWACAADDESQVIQTYSVGQLEMPAPTDPNTDVNDNSQAEKYTGGTPTIEFESLTYDFGQVGTSTTGTGLLNFKNVGDGILNISDIIDCCGANTTLRNDKTRYLPGETGVLEISYNFGASPDVFTKEILVNTNDPKNTAVIIKVKAKIVQKITQTPQRLNLLLSEKNAGCSPIELVSVDNVPFSITGFSATGDVMKADFDPNEKAIKHVLNPVVDMDKARRNIQGRVVIETTHPQCRNIMMLYDILPPYTVTPPQIYTPGLRPYEPVNRIAWILSNYDKELDIESFSSQNNYITIAKQQKYGNRINLELEITPPEKEDTGGLITDRLKIKMKDGEELSISFRGFYQ